MSVSRDDCVLPTGDTVLDLYYAGVWVCTSGSRPSTPFEGQHIYETDTDKTLKWNGSSWVEIGGGIWDDGTVVDLKTAKDIDLQGKKIYLDYSEGASDSDRNYIWVNASGNIEFHIASGEAVEWTVG